MNLDKPHAVLGAALLGALAAFWRWHTPRARKLTPEEIDRYLDAIAELPLPDGEARELAARLRPWAEADDGRPVYMLNLNRYHPDLNRWAGAPDFDGTPEQASARYDKGLAPLFLRHGAYPILLGTTQGEPVMATDPARAPWSTVQVVRQPSRRTFLRLLSDPAFARFAPYKFMAFETDLQPVSARLVVPDARWVVAGGLLAAYLVSGWVRSTRG